MRGWWRQAVGASLLALASWSAAGLSAVAAPAVPIFSQRSHQWSRDALGSDPIDTIGSTGCALTAVTMVNPAYRHSTNPQQLNRRLTCHRRLTENKPLVCLRAPPRHHGPPPPVQVHSPAIALP